MLFMKLIEPIVSSAAEMAAIRRDLHAHPELCFQEVRTADVVAQQLTDWGIPIHRGMGTTGVVGIIKNGTSDRAIGLRADMDALPMQEFNKFPHASQNPGKMHACGHDGHVAMLLAAAQHLSKNRNFDGTVTRAVFDNAHDPCGAHAAVNGYPPFGQLGRYHVSGALLLEAKFGMRVDIAAHSADAGGLGDE